MDGIGLMFFNFSCGRSFADESGFFKNSDWNSISKAVEFLVFFLGRFGHVILVRYENFWNLNYYLSGAVCAVCVCLSEKNFSCCFGEQTSRVLEFKPEGLEG